MEICNYTGLLLILACSSASVSAQILKLLLALMIERKFDWKKLFSTGGMPSSHSAFVSCLASFIGFHEGLESVPFAIATCVAFIVMHDAMSVRRSVGLQARQINNLTEIFTEVTTQMSQIFEEALSNHTVRINKIKELLGHSPVEVVAGAIHGVLIGFVFFKLCAG